MPGSLSRVLLVAVVAQVQADDPYANQAPLGPDYGCLMHELAWEFAQNLPASKLLPPGSLRHRQVWESLFTGDMEEGNFGGGKMGSCNQTTPPGAAKPVPPTPAPLASEAPAWFVDATKGSDTAAGTQDKPFRTIACAINASRAHNHVERRVVLRAGLHTLDDAIALGPQDSGLVIENFAKEETWMSGAAPLPDDLAWEQYKPHKSYANLSTCPANCLVAGHCCVGDISSYQTPSCSMGCMIADQSPTTAACMKVCDDANRKTSYKWKNHTFNLAGSCPKGCSASDGVSECYAGCSFGLGPPLLDIWQAKLPESIDVAAGFWGLHLLSDPEHPWHTMQTLARWPNRITGYGVRDTRFARIGSNATWEAMKWTGAGSQLGHQHVSNATTEIPKNLTVFPDAFVYGVGGLCGKDHVGFDPPGGYVCSVHGGMHGGDIDERTGRWSCPGCTDGYPKAWPAALTLINTSGAEQNAFPHAHTWPTDVTDAILETWVNGWFTTWWKLTDFDAATGTLKLGRGGFHGGQPHMLDGLSPDGSVGPPDEFLPEANFTNPLDSPSMGGVMIQNLLAELDVQEEWYYNSSSRMLYFYPNRTNATGGPPTEQELGGKLGVVRLQNLLRIEGGAAGPTAVPGKSAGWKPARNITIRGIGFRDAGYTYLAPHGVPSGGDWGMQSPQYADTAGAVYLSGTEGVRFEGCTFKYLAGNAVYLAGYNRDAAVVESELTQIGDSPIVQWGWTESTDPLMPAGTGMDGTAGNQPRGTQIIGNLCHEYGFNQKQSS